jgi:uncharacterized membrane protein (DUF485 family)
MNVKLSPAERHAASKLLTDAETSNAKLGIILFFVYLVFYSGFVLINAFQADLMDKVVFAGLNLAVVYGFALIVVAIAMSMVYGLWCKIEPLAAEPTTDRLEAESDSSDRDGDRS